MRCLWTANRVLGRVRRYSSTTNVGQADLRRPLDQPDCNSTISGKTYTQDSWSNITPRMISYIGRNIYLQQNHPLWLIKERLVAYFHWRYQNRRSPSFAVIDNLHPLVTVEQNFDSLLIPENHPSRRISDSYYANQQHVLRAHTSAHQLDLLRSGLRQFLVVGDVYRRDEIDATHYPVFHQMEGVRLRFGHELKDDSPDFRVMQSAGLSERTPKKQAVHTQTAVELMEKDLKDCLEGAARSLFGQKAEMRWMDTYFPFTHPSWELEVKHKDKWLELLGCGIMEHELLRKVGIEDQIGWAFGVGLERLAMHLYDIPDIRLFWSEDSGFLNQFNVDGNIRKIIKYKPVSQFPQCTNDISFWIPDKFEKNDFFELVRNCGGDLVEQVTHVDEFKHPRTGRWSHCYRIVYRHMEKTLSKEEVNQIHNTIGETAAKQLGVQIR